MSTVSKTISLAAASSQYLSASDSTSLSTTGNQTHEGWVSLNSNPSSGSGYVIFTKYRAAAGARGIAVNYENSAGTFRFHARTSADGTNVSEGTLNYTLSSGFHYLRFVYSTSGTMDIYVDDLTTKVGTISGLTASIFDNSEPYKIGGNTDIDGYLDGKISVWRVWNATHTTWDKFTVYGSAQTNMSAEWSLDNVLTDASGNSNTLTNNGSATFGTTLPGGLDGGIGFDTSAKDAGSGASSRTFAHTVNTSNEILIVCAFSNQVSNPITGVTYNGVSMTAIGTFQSGTGAGGLIFYYLLNPATGTNNVVVSQTGTNYLLGASASYVTAKQSGQPDSQAQGEPGTTTTITLTTTVVAANCWLIAAATSSGGTGYTASGTMRQSTSDPFGLQDSNGTISTGSQSLTFTNSTSAAHSPWQIISIAPAVAVTDTQEARQKARHTPLHFMSPGSVTKI